jgi:fructuronate reductase
LSISLAFLLVLLDKNVGWIYGFSVYILNLMKKWMTCMELKILNQRLLDDASFWKGKNVLLPKYDRKKVPVKSICFSAGRMAYGHTGDIMQDLLNLDPDTGLMVGVETFSPKYVTELAASDFLMTQPIFENEKGKVVPKVQGAIQSILFVDGNTSSLAWAKLLEFARDPQVQFATINAPEGAYGVSYSGGEFATPINPVLKKDMEEGTINSDPAKWTAFAMERFKAGLKFAMVSCTNFSGNGHFTGATLRTVAKAWEEKGLAPKGFVKYLSDEKQFSFPNCMIDRIAVSPDEATQKVMASIGIRSNMVVTEKARYWAVEDIFPAGRPKFEKAEGVFMEKTYEDVKKYEDMKLRILNMAHSTIAGIGVLLGYKGKYGIYNAMQKKEIAALIQKIIDIVIKTVGSPKQMDPKAFAKAAIERLNNSNIPDDPMRIALNGSTKMLPRFMDTYFAGEAKGLSKEELNYVLLPVAGFMRYTMGIDDKGEKYNLEDDPLKELLIKCGSNAKIGDKSSVSSFKELITHKDIVGKDLYKHGDTGATLESMIAKMLAGNGSVEKTLKEYVKV